MARTLAKYFAEVNGFENGMEIEILAVDGDIFTVLLDGKEYKVDYSDFAQNVQSFIIDNVSYGVEVVQKENVFGVFRGEDYFRVELLDEMQKYRKEQVSQQVKGRQIIDTQMPGQITKIFVEEGQQVKEGEPLMILVAMKMENEIRSPKAGVVQEIFVTEGAVINNGDKLIIIE